MKKRGFLKGLFALVALAAFIAVSAPPAMASGTQIYRMRGKITAVDVADNTVVIDVPVAKNKIFTVAGPLATDATLKKGSRDVTLKDFHEGEWVTVKWQPTESGHLIKGLIGK